MKCALCNWDIGNPDADLIRCPNPRCNWLQPTGMEAQFRETFENNRSHLPWPEAAAGRAIAYASAVYGFATHGETIDLPGIEAAIRRRRGEAAGGHSATMMAVGMKRLGALRDRGAASVVIHVAGVNHRSGGTKGQPWNLLYIVFRGSRGDLPGTPKNPRGAGWDRAGGGNVDWRANLSKEQAVPSWCAAAGVHGGILQLYESARHAVGDMASSFMSEHRMQGGAVIVTGHSQGAALAILAAHDLEHTYGSAVRPFCFAFCPPRVGDLAFARDYSTVVAEPHGLLWCEAGDRLDFARSFLFTQGDDPVSHSGKHGFLHRMGLRSAGSVADSGKIFKQGWYAANKRETPLEIYYHVPNVRRQSVMGEHDHVAMRKKVLGE